MIAPVGTIDSGASITPACSVLSFCGDSTDYRVRLTIDTVYDETIDVTGHPPGASRRVMFPVWSAAHLGTYAVRCSTIYSDDTDSSNDFRTGQATVTLTDAGVEAISRPLEVMEPGSTPVVARVRNYGSVRAVNIRFSVRITGTSGPVYADSTVVAGLDPGSALNVSFRSWNALAGEYTMTARTRLSGDLVPANDSMMRRLAVGRMDLGVVQILEPVGRKETMTVVVPAATLRNYGDVAVDCRAWFSIVPEGSPRVYFDSSSRQRLPGGSELRFESDTWPLPHPAGRYTVRCSTGVLGDAVPGNNVLTGEFLVSGTIVPAGWVQKPDMPAGAKDKAVKAGGCLAGYTYGLTSYVYGLKGNNRCEFYRYDVSSDAWWTLESIPAFGSSGKKKGVKKGGSIATRGNSRYSRAFATKGGNTLDYWLYDPAASGYKWVQLPDVPAGTEGVKDGTGQVCLQSGDTTFTYLLKGSGTTEFYRFNSSNGLWATLSNAPTGESGKPYKSGSCIAYDGARTIYCLKGTYGEFFAYDIATNTWTTLATLPKTGTAGKKKVKDGAGLVWYEGLAYALKGGGTTEFWRYDGAGWAELVNMPLGGGKKVKSGGALTATADALYALKGNKTLEFYQYGASAYNASRPADFTLAGQGGIRPRPANLRLDAFPNPVVGVATITYSLPRAGPMSLKLYDVTGKLVRILASGQARTGSRSLAIGVATGGVYLLKLETADAVLTRKLIVE